MVPRWKRALSRAMTAGLHAAMAAQDRRLPVHPLPTDDPWYSAPEPLSALAPGTLLAWREIEFRGKPNFGAQARSWQLRFRSTDTAGAPISAVATLMVPTEPWRGVRSVRPLLSYQCAIDSLGAKADPSYTLRRGGQREFPLMALGLRRGWAVVTADYTGPRRAYGAGLVAARITLDGIRAALSFEEAGLSPDAPVGLWGYSGGGQATAWTAEQHPVYAPELRMAAVAAGGVPTDNRTLYRIDGGFFSGLSLGASLGISREYPETEVLQRLNDAGRAVFEEIADMSVDELVAYFPFRRLAELTTVADPFGTEGALVTNEELALGRAVPAAPVYLYHSIHDQLVPIEGADELAQTYRRGGVEVTMRRSHLGEHVIFAGLGVRGALRYLSSRLGAPASAARAKATEPSPAPAITAAEA
jgi:pimeloyl-ACP methyl ester carboxylesterase